MAASALAAHGEAADAVGHKARRLASQSYSIRLLSWKLTIYDIIVYNHMISMIHLRVVFNLIHITSYYLQISAYL